MYYTRGMKQARIARPGEPYCNQHHQPRAQCDPRSRHPHSLRCSDELMAAVEARAASMGLDRNAGVEAALEEWAGRAVRAESSPVSVTRRAPRRRDGVPAPPGSVKFSGDTGAGPALVPGPDRGSERGRS